MSEFENVKVIKTSGPFTQKEYEMFCWGRVVAIHKIGTIEIIEYIPTGTGEKTRTLVELHNCFHINGFSQSTWTLDAAIATALALKYDGYGSQAGRYICKMLGIITGYYNRPKRRIK